MWTKGLPSEPGIYWFYGNQFQTTPMKLKLLRVTPCKGGVVRVCEGAFMFPAEVGEVQWHQKAELPLTPGQPRPKIE